jgi:hypothetical protein
MSLLFRQGREIIADRKFEMSLIDRRADFIVFAIMLNLFEQIAGMATTQRTGTGQVMRIDKMLNHFQRALDTLFLGHLLPQRMERARF